MNTYTSILGFTLACLLAPVGSVFAGDCTVIDFETLPDGSPTVDVQTITDEYTASCGVTFELIGAPDGAEPTIAKVGPPRTAFQGVNRDAPECGVDTVSRADTPASPIDVGCTFLTDDADVGGLAHTLRITYTDPVTQAGAVLLDIDANEQWTVTARRADASVLGTVVLDAGAGEGETTSWEFDAAGEGDVIKTIDLEFTGTGSAVGLAFDNFFVSARPDAVGACCLPGNACAELSAAECAAAGGNFTTEGMTCDPNPCLATPVEAVTWGHLKSIY